MVKAKIEAGKVIIELSKKEAKILGEMGDYSKAICEEIANGFEKSFFFSYSGEEVKKLMKGIHWALVDLFDEIPQSESKPKRLKRKEEYEP